MTGLAVRRGRRALSRVAARPGLRHRRGRRADPARSGAPGDAGRRPARRPGTAPAVAALLDRPGRQGPGVETWQGRRADADDRNRVTSIVLTTYTALVLVAVGLMIATFVGARVLARRRELALLKAAGFTPRQLMLLALIENLAIALAGATRGCRRRCARLAPRIVKDTAR